MEKIKCFDKDNTVKYFVYSVEKGEPPEYEDREEEKEYQKWSFKVMMPNNTNDSQWFDFEVTEVDDNIGKVTVMNHNNYSNFKGKGIPDKMIEEASGLLEKTIISSSNNANFKLSETEFRSLDATKVWERLVTQGKARYNEDEDIYEFL